MMPLDKVSSRRVQLMAATWMSIPLLSSNAAVGFKKELKPRRNVIPLDEYLPVDNCPGLLSVDVRLGDMKRLAKQGDRVAVHYDVKWKSLTIGSSRVGAGVTGGNPYGFEVGRFGGPGGPFIRAMDEGIVGMGVGGQRRLLVPPEYGYGNKQVQEIPPGSTLQVDLELLSIKTNPLQRK